MLPLAVIATKRLDTANHQDTKVADEEDARRHGDLTPRRAARAARRAEAEAGGGAGHAKQLAIMASP